MTYAMRAMYESGVNIGVVVVTLDPGLPCPDFILHAQGVTCTTHKTLVSLCSTPIPLSCKLCYYANMKYKCFYQTCVSVHRQTGIHSFVVPARGRRIMLANLPIMLCCTAPKMYLLCSTNAPIMLNYQQNSFPEHLTRKLTRSLRAFLITLPELASHQCLAVGLL